MDRRIAVTIEELPQGEVRVANDFRHCSKFVVFVVDENNKVIREESYKNYMQGKRGKDTQLPCFVYQLGANAIIAGGMGHRTVSKFENYNIQVVTAPAYKIGDALYEYLSGGTIGKSAFHGQKVSHKN